MIQGASLKACETQNRSLRRSSRCKALWAKPTQVLKPRVPEEGIYLRQFVDKRVASRGIDSLLSSWIQAFASRTIGAAATSGVREADASGTHLVRRIGLLPRKPVTISRTEHKVVGSSGVPGGCSRRFIVSHLISVTCVQ